MWLPIFERFLPTINPVPTKETSFARSVRSILPQRCGRCSKASGAPKNELTSALFEFFSKRALAFVRKSVYLYLLLATNATKRLKATDL